MSYNFSTLKQKVTEIEEWLKKELATIRTGRAAPAILDSILVDSYGAKMHINQMASVITEGPRTLRVTPWDVTQGKSIEKAIVDAQLGLSASTDDKGLRIIFPELTTERRQSLSKIVRQKHEEARVALRKEREGVWEDIQEKEKAGVIVEDDKFRFKSELQKVVDDSNRRLDEMVGRKEQEILS